MKWHPLKKKSYACMMDLYIDESVVLFFFFSHEGETHFHLQSLHFFSLPQI